MVFKETNTTKLWEKIRQKHDQQKKNYSLGHHVLDNTQILIDEESIDFDL